MLQFKDNMLQIQAFISILKDLMRSFYNIRRKVERLFLIEKREEFSKEESLQMRVY